MSEQEEIEVGEKAKDYHIQQYQEQGALIDNDKETLEKVKTILDRITKVSHRPNLPWEIHVVDTKEANAFALPGGKIFVLKGIVGILVKSDDELAGIIAHEVAHITCRHQVREQTWNLVMPMIQKRARKEIYKASYSTIQEDEADRVGLLYMALAGYDPQSVYNIWKRADMAYGSSPGNYLYDHSLNIDRANKVSQLIPLARNYFVGDGVENANYSNLLLNNELTPRKGFQSDSGLLTVLELGLNTYTQYLKTKNEQVNREQEKAQKESYLRFVRVANVRKQSTTDGYVGLFADVTNLSNTLMKKVTVEVYYLDGANKVLYSETRELANIPSSGRANAGFYLKNVPNYKNISMAATNVEF
jgi:predicted Zn-dependent protease